MSGTLSNLPSGRGGPPGGEGTLFGLGRTTAAVLVLFLVLGVAARFVGLSINGYWLDEIVSIVQFSDPRHPLGRLILTQMVQDYTPPLYYILLYFWRSAFGETEVTTRLLSVLFSLVTVALPLLWRSDGLTPRRRLVFATLLATSYAVIYHAQEARSYGLLMTVTTAITLGLFDVARRLADGRPLPRTTFPVLTLLGVLAAYTHYFGLLFYGAVCAVVLVLALLRRRPGAAVGAVVSGLVVLAALLPWVRLVIAAHAGRPDTGYIEASLYFVARSLGTFALLLSGNWALFPVMAAVFLAYLVVLLRRAARGEAFRADDGRTTAGLALYGVAFLTAAFGLVLTLTFVPVLTGRNLLAVLPALFLVLTLAAEEADRGNERRRALAATAFLAVMLFGSLATYYRPHKDGWREAAAVINAAPSCRGASIPVWGPWAAFYAHYLRPDMNLRLIETGRNTTPGRTERVLAELPPDEDCPVLAWAAHLTEPELDVYLRRLGLDPRTARVDRTLFNSYLILRPSAPRRHDGSPPPSTTRDPEPEAPRG